MRSTKKKKGIITERIKIEEDFPDSQSFPHSDTNIQLNKPKDEEFVVICSKIEQIMVRQMKRAPCHPEIRASDCQQDFAGKIQT